MDTSKLSDFIFLVGCELMLHVRNYEPKIITTRRNVSERYLNYVPSLKRFAGDFVSFAPRPPGSLLQTFGCFVFVTNLT
jgi:hypothetical protein